MYIIIYYKWLANVLQRSCWVLLTLASIDELCVEIAHHGAIELIIGGIKNCIFDAKVIIVMRQ